MSYDPGAGSITLPIAESDVTDLVADLASKAEVPIAESDVTGLVSDLAGKAALAHHTQHEAGGGDVIKLDDLGTPDDNTDLDATTEHHGLLDKLPGGTSNFKRADGAWAVPPGTGAGANATSSTAIGSEPGSPSTGDLDLYNNAPEVARYSGSAWVPWGPLFPFTAPVSGDFSWVNQGGATIDTTRGGIILYAPTAGGVSLRCRKKAVPVSTPYTIEVAFIPMMVAANYSSMGLFWTDGTKLTTWGPLVSGAEDRLQLGINAFNTTTSYSSTTYAQHVTPSLSVVWLRIKDDGTNRLYYWSTNGINWQLMYSEGRTTWLTPTDLGFFADAENASYDAYMHLLHWKQL